MGEERETAAVDGLKSSSLEVRCMVASDLSVELKVCKAMKWL